jgi:hypothetical protein
MFYVIRLTFKPGAGHAWSVAYAGADRSEARAAFDHIELDQVECICKVLAQQQPTGLAALDSDWVEQPRADEDPGWLAHVPAAVATIEEHAHSGSA